MFLNEPKPYVLPLFCVFMDTCTFLKEHNNLEEKVHSRVLDCIRLNKEDQTHWKLTVRGNDF